MANFTNTRPGPGTSVTPTSPGVQPGGPLPGNPIPAANGNAFATLKTMLESYGLGSLANFAYNALVSGKSEAEIIRDIRETPEFATRFPAIKAREDAGLPALSPAEYVAYERQAAQLMRAAGLPKGFYDNNDDFTKFLTADVSLAEMQQRIELGRDAAYNAPADVKAQLREMYGVTEGALTAYFLDPNRAEPLLAQQFQASRISASAQRTGFGALAAREAEQLAKQGISEEQASQGFGQLAGNAELFTNLQGSEQDEQITRDEQIGAVFNNAAAARKRIEDKRNRRLAGFQGGGGMLDSQEGVAGLADSRRR